MPRFASLFKRAGFMTYCKMGTRQNRSTAKIICLVGAILLMPGPACRSDGDTDKQSEKINISQSRRKSAFPRGTPLGGGRLTAKQTESIPVNIVNFHSSEIPSQKHPFLFYTEDDINEAQKRVTDPKYRQAIHTLNTEADKTQQAALNPIDSSWWENIKTKPWSDTYPIIYERTCLVPLRMVRPAYYAALRFALAKDEKDAEVAKKILLHISDYSFEFEHFDVGMNYAVWGQLALNVYDVLFERFRPAERVKLNAFFTRMARAVMKNDAYWIKNNIGGGINNHLAWHKMMLGCLGLFYGRGELADYALHGPRGILSLLELGLVDDGLWCESSLNYHFTAIIPMVYFAEALRNAGYKEDLYTATTANGRNIRQSFDSMFGVLFPDGGIPPIGDTYGWRKRLCDEFSYVYAWKAYRAPRYAWLLEKAPLKKPELLFVGVETEDAILPNITSCLYPEHGYAFLRDRQGKDYWGSDGWCAFLTFDKSGVHSNNDKLSLMLFGQGKLLAPDVESRATAPHAFSSRIQRELNRSALSQNTVMIDYRDQRGTGERLWLEEYRNLPEEKAVTAIDRKGLLYEGVRQSRTICVRREYVLDVFQVVSDTPHDIHWIIHTIGKPESQKTSIALQPSQMKIPGPGSWLRDFKEGKSDGEIRIEWLEDSVRFRMTMAPKPETKVIVCGYPETDKPDAPTIPMLMVERRAASTIYAVVYQAGNKDLPELHIQALGDADGRLVYQVSGPWGNRRHLIPRLQ